MPRLTHKVPAYRKHASGQAIVVISYKTNYLGPYGSKSSRMLYDRLIAEWLSSDRRPIAEDPQSTAVAEIIMAYWKHGITACRTESRAVRKRTLSTF